LLTFCFYQNWQQFIKIGVLITNFLYKKITICSKKPIKFQKTQNALLEIPWAHSILQGCSDKLNYQIVFILSVAKKRSTQNCPLL